ncbi:MAG: hypothetical protein LBJ59_11890 [Zoogloeaceae bacterium]|jgi:hypothetical protein|nr:hypothetical protein [Zoogloeaceae bacterium]
MTPVAKSIIQAALLALLLAALGAGLAGFGQQERQRASLEAEQSAALLNAARARLYALQDPEVERLATQWAELSAQGFFAATTPESLAARLQAVRIALGLVETRPVFSPPQRWGDGATQLWQSELNLELSLNHEQEFVDFWRVLAWPGPLRVTDCALERNPARDPLPRPAPNLKAACHLQWLAGSQPTRDREP